MPVNTKPNSIDCIIPAAGLSSRMGCWKLMLPYKEGTVLEASIKNALSFCSRVILVAGHRADELISQYQHHSNITMVSNPNYPSGMFSSVKAGIESVKSEYFFICHGDMPCVTTEIYQALWQERLHGVVFPGTPQQSGHPVIIHSSAVRQKVMLDQYDSMKPLLLQLKTKYLNISDSGIHLDVDTPEAYQQLLHSTPLDPAIKLIK